MLKKVPVRLFRTVPVAKPEKKAFQANEAYSIEQLKEILPDGRRWDVSYKADGIRCQIHKDGNKIMFLSDEGKALPDARLALLIEEVKKKLPAKAILDGELMFFRDGKNQGHQGIVSFLRKREVEETDREGLRYLFFDVLLWSGGELDGKPLSARFSYLKYIKDGTYMKRASHVIVSEDEIISAQKKVGSPEGVIVREINSTYWQTNLMFKLKHSWDFDAKVVQVKKTESGADVYTCQDREGNIVGLTYAQSYLRAKIGDVIRVTVTEVSKRIDPKIGKAIYHWYNPRVLREKQAKGGGRAKSLKKEDRRVDGQVLLERIYSLTRGKAK